MHKKFLVLLTGSIALSISAVPVLASDPPTDDGQYIWQDENGDYWYRNGSEDEYIGEGNYAPDPDSGELMEGNDAGWTEQDGYFEPHYYYEDGSVWLEDATGTTYIGSRDKYYIDDYGNFRNIPNRLPKIPPHRILILHPPAPLPLQTQKNPLNQKSVASFICGLGSLPMIRSENPCPKKEVISSSVP